MTTNTYTAADFEYARIAHRRRRGRDYDIAVRTHRDSSPWTVFYLDDAGAIYWDSYRAPCHQLAADKFTPGHPPRNGNDQDVRERDETIKEQRARIEDLLKAVWERGEIIGDLREDLASAEARVPSTPEDAITLAWELSHKVPEKQMIPAGTPLIEKWESVSRQTVFLTEGFDVDLPATSGCVERRTLSPLTPPRPKHAEVIGGVLIAEVGMHDDDARDTADKIARAIEEQETDDE